MTKESNIPETSIPKKEKSHPNKSDSSKPFQSVPTSTKRIILQDAALINILCLVNQADSFRAVRQVVRQLVNTMFLTWFI